MNRRQYGMVDLVKFLLSLLVVTAHYVAEYGAGRMHPIVDFGMSSAVIIVPFFFACSAFLLFKKLYAKPEQAGDIIKNFLLRILKMYLLWSVVYITFQVLTWVRFGTSPRRVLKYVLNCILYSSYDTIWFLPALLVGTALTWFFYKKFGFKVTLIAAGCCYLLGALGVSYSWIPRKIEAFDRFLEAYEFAFVTTRNGLFIGFPLVTIGAWMARREFDGHTYKLGPSLIGCIVFGLGFVCEAFIIKPLGAVNVHTMLLQPFFSYFFFALCLSIPMNSGKVLKWMRSISITIFVCQRIWLTAVPGLFPDSIFASILTGNPYIGWLYSMAITMATGLLLHWLGKRNRLFAAMC